MPLTFEQLTNNVQEWAAARGIYEHSSARAQLLKAFSEMGEPIRSRDLAGRALDLAVARAEGLVYADGWLVRPSRRANGRWKGEHTMPLADYRPSQDWGLAGPIIEREQIGVCRDHLGWVAHKGHGLWQSYTVAGDNALQAAMRCYVISRFGDTYSGENPEGK